MIFMSSAPLNNMMCMEEAMLRFFKAITAFSGFCLAVMILPGSAEARTCRETYCAKRAPFVCPGKPGSCGFAQGRCIRTGVRIVQCGGPFVQPR